IAELGVVARYPAYLKRDAQPIATGRDTVLLPEGTELVTSGALSVPAESLSWIKQGGTAAAHLAVRGSHFSGRFAPSSGLWRLIGRPASGGVLEGDTPELRVRIVPDSAPTVAVPVPGRDTMLPITLREPLVIDVRDDHGISRVEIVSWRVGRSGKVGEQVHQPLDVAGVGDRALIQGELDAERRGLLPGDTL